MSSKINSEVGRPVDREWAASFKTRLENKTATIGIVGLGYVGLPLIQAFVNAGFRTIGFDVDGSKIAKPI